MTHHTITAPREPPKHGGVHLSTVAFVSLMTVLVLPWVLLALHTQTSHEAPWHALDKNSGNGLGRIHQEVREGAWGQLWLAPITISPRDQSLPPGWSRPLPPSWFFAGYDESSLRAFFAGLKLPSKVKADLVDVSRWEISSDGIRMSPSAESIFSLETETRIKLYALLARYPGNHPYHQPWSMKTTTFQQALASSGLTPETRQLIQAVAYPAGNRTFVADGSSIIHAIEDEQEKIRAIRFLKAAETYMVDLNIQPGDPLKTKLDYWGERRGQKDIRPVIESMVHSADGGVLDIIHMLPAFARDRLYSYPDPASTGGSVRRDCHWSSLNFFADTPDDRFGNTEFVQQYVMENYYASVDAPGFGDIIFFTTRNGEIVHSATYLAADLAFTKNGDDIHQPWLIMSLADLQELYSAFSQTAVTMQTWKRKPAEKN